MKVVTEQGKLSIKVYRDICLLNLNISEQVASIFIALRLFALRVENQPKRALKTICNLGFGPDTRRKIVAICFLQLFLAFGTV